MNNSGVHCLPTPPAVDPSPSGRETCLRVLTDSWTAPLQTSEAQLPRANQPRMELSPYAAASKASAAAALIRLVARKPKKEDYSDYKAFRREYKRWHGSWTRCHQEVHDPAKREAERERDSARHAERRARPPEPAQPSRASRSHGVGRRLQKASPAPGTATTASGRRRTCAA